MLVPHCAVLTFVFVACQTRSYVTYYGHHVEHNFWNATWKDEKRTLYRVSDELPCLVRGGLFPELVLYLAFFHPKERLQIRLEKYQLILS